MNGKPLSLAALPPLLLLAANLSPARNFAGIKSGQFAACLTENFRR